MMNHNTKFENKMFGGFEDISGQTLKFWPFAVTLTLNAVIQFFHMPLWHIMMYHQTKFGCQRINSLENIVES